VTKRLCSRFAGFPVLKFGNLQKERDGVKFMDATFPIPRVHLPFVYYVEFNELEKFNSAGLGRTEGGNKETAERTGYSWQIILSASLLLFSTYRPLS
jgi:hypothetical protein